MIKAFDFYILLYNCAINTILVSAQASLETLEQGKAQYQLLREKSNLPQYGTCWKGAVEYVEEGCTNLSDETQSNMALHITNCFLEMSGHETYNCELDKKPNMRRICINSMSDRAFNVYTEFYTHVQNICWFLRGQIWHEILSENSYKVGKQLEESAKNQEELLKTQRDSLQMQKKILKQKEMLERVLGDLYISTKNHQEILRILTKSVANFQSWILGEVSWFDSIIFYILSALFTLIFTSLKRTSSARLPLLLLMFSNLMIERSICSFLISEDSILDSQALYQSIYLYIWYCRYFFIILAIFYLIYCAYNFKDLIVENNKYLNIISKQNLKILHTLSAHTLYFKQNPTISDKVDLINENSCHNFSLTNGFSHKSEIDDFDEMKFEKNFSVRAKTHLPSSPMQNGRYNLRSRQNTPDFH